MAIVNTGATLVAPILQSGWTVVSDGFGLHTSVSVYKADYTSALTAFLVKGTAHPDPAYTYLKIDKWRISWDALDMATVTVDYVGIDPSINSGVRTNPNTSSANGLTSEPLTSHPNFFTADPLFAGVIAGAGPYDADTLGPLVQSKTTPKGEPTLSFTGLNGACFESENGGRFIGFVDPIYPSFYGKTNYLATTTSYSGVMYSTSLADVQALLALLNTATDTASWGVFDLLPAWAPIGTVVNIGHVNLLSQVNVEQFGSLYKINYEIRYSKTGWDDYVYTNI
jgi:hypothetical protein